MEIFVHLADDAVALEFVYFEVDIPASVSVLSVKRLPKGWRSEPPSEESMRIGDRWLEKSLHTLLEVPSAIIPTETNLILNPLHQDTRRLRISPPRRFQFDPRMWK
jgi:RES domain-containing protein